MPVVGYLLLFTVIVVGFIILNLFVGWLVRPKKPHEEKGTIYECGEPTIGSAWVQFDVRYYVVALLFVIFDVEVAFFFPWAVVYGQSAQVAHQSTMPESPAEQAAIQEKISRLSPGYDGAQPLTDSTLKTASDGAQSFTWLAFVDILVFFGVLLVGFAYLWKRGDLAWVRTVTSSNAQATGPPPDEAKKESPELVGSGS